MSSSGTESDSSASSDVDFDGLWRVRLPTRTRIYGRRNQTMEEAASAQRREIENNPRQNDTHLISTDIHLDKVRKRS